MAAKGVGGKGIGRTFYPCQKKMVYRLSLSSVMHNPKLRPLQGVPSPTFSSDASVTRDALKVEIASVRPTDQPSEKLRSLQRDLNQKAFAENMDSGGGGGVEAEAETQGPAAVVDLQKSEYFRSLLQPLRHRRTAAISAYVPSPGVERSARKSTNGTRSTPSRHAHRALMRGEEELATSLSVHSRTLLPNLNGLDGSILSNSSLPLHSSTTGPAPPFPSLLSLKKSSSFTGEERHLDSSNVAGSSPQPALSRTAPAAIARSSSLSSSSSPSLGAAQRDPLDSLLKTSLRKLIQSEGGGASTEDAMGQTAEQPSSSEPLPCADPGRIIPLPSVRGHEVSSATPVFTDSTEVAKEEGGRGRGHGSDSDLMFLVPTIATQDGSSTSFLSHSSSWEPLHASNMRTTRREESDARPFRTVVQGRSPGRPPRLGVPQTQTQTYRKHKAATHKLQLNRGFKYSRNTTLINNSSLN